MFEPTAGFDVVAVVVVVAEGCVFLDPPRSENSLSHSSSISSILWRASSLITLVDRTHSEKIMRSLLGECCHKTQQASDSSN